MTVDYSVYLVTDSGLVPEGLTLYDQVKASVENGATIVQLREKHLETKEFIERAQAIHEITKKAGIPLIINDRLDVAIAVDAEGIHVGQDDFPVAKLRQILGPNKIIGLSVKDVDEAREAIKENLVDYIGIGALYATATKELKKIPMGPQGAREVLKVLRDEGGQHIKSVLIGGINDSNASRSLYTSAIPGKSTDGIAVVSNIIASKDAGLATKKLSDIVKNTTKSFLVDNNTTNINPSSEIIENVKSISPMVHQITNNVVKLFSANVTLAIGASPIMSEDANDYSEFAKYPNSTLLLNTGTVQEPQIYLKAVREYNLNLKPVVLDPVGAGASVLRRLTIKNNLNNGHYTVIKGNEGEILTAAGIETQMKGVDSVEKNSIEFLIAAAKKLALNTRSIVVVTGETDIIVDGSLTGEYYIDETVKQTVVTINGGHHFLGKVTGSGCSLGSVIASYLGSNPKTPFLATITAVALYKEAGTRAGKISSGPGSFVPNFIDELYKLTLENNPKSWTLDIKSV